MSTIPSAEALLVRRSVAGALAAYLQLPPGCLSAPFLDPETDAGRIGAAGQWWQSQAPAQRIPAGIIATLAAPVLMADIRIMLEQSTLTKTWALAGGIEPEAHWLLLAPVTSEGDYHVQPCAGRAAVTSLLTGYLTGCNPAWESQMRFQLKTPAFALLLALADLYSRAQYASLLTQQAIPEGFTLEDVRTAWENAIQRPDQRYLFPLAAHLFPDSLSNLLPADAATLVSQLVAVGLMTQDAQGFGWSDSGRFFVSSLHRRNVTLAVEVASADAQSRLGTHAALFVRADLPLWYFDIGPDDCIAAGVEETKARQLLDEILKPVGVPPARQMARVAAPIPMPVAVPAPTDLCVRCGATLKPNAKFCERCGQTTQAPAPAPVPAGCPRCQSPFAPGTKFCVKCGARLG